MEKQNLINVFLGNLIKVPVLTVVITALLGPFAINWINNSIKNKEIQKDVIKEILGYTNDADFSKNESIEKIGILAKMVDENESVFGLSFQKTNDAFKELYNMRSEFGLARLQEDLQIKNEELVQLRNKNQQDSLIRRNEINYKEELTKQLTALKANNKLTTAQKREAEQLLKAKIQEKEYKVKYLSESLTMNKNNLENLAIQKSEIETRYSESQKELNRITVENRENIETLQEQKEELHNIEDDKEKLVEELTNRISELEKALSKINNLNSEISNLNLENERLERELIKKVKEINKQNIANIGTERNATQQ